MAKAKLTNFTTEPHRQEIIMTRVFDAAREQVFKAYTDPDLIPQWWGPKDYTTTVEKIEPKPGGLWRFIQHAPDGKEYCFHGVFHSVIPSEQIISTFEFEGKPGHVSLETLSLKEQRGKTKLTNTSVFQTIEDRDGMLKSGMEEGAAETMDRLAKLLAKDAQNRPHGRKSPT